MVCIEFDNEKIQKWFKKDEHFPSRWIDPLPTIQPSVDKELVDFIESGRTLFFNAVARGDLRIVQLLHIRGGIDINIQDDNNGMTALQIACKEGHLDIARWIIFDTKVDLEVADDGGYRALHHAIKRY